MYGYEDDYDDVSEIGDYYCDICDAHMNSVQMWESHISGKRHLKNKKKPGESSKIKSIVRDDIPSLLMRLVRSHNEPIVGLCYMSELQRVEPGIDPTYTCYICHGNFTRSTVIPHLTSTKHRLNYIKAVDHRSYHAINSLKLTTAALDALVEEKSAEWEQTAGRGTVEVKLEKPKNVSSVEWYNENKRYMSRKEPPQILHSSSRSAYPTKREPPRPPTASSRPHLNIPSTSSSRRPPPSKTSSPRPPPSKTSSPRPPPSKTSSPCPPSASASALRDAPSTSSSALPDSPAPDDSSIMKETEPQGITDIDLLRDIGMCSTEMQLELLEYLLVKEPPPIETEEDLQEAIELLNSAKQVLLKWRVDRMSLEEQQRFVNAVMLQEEDPVYKWVFGPADMKK